MALELTASELGRRCLHGESGAWAALIDQYARLVRAVAARIGWHEPDYVELPLRVP